MRRAVLLIPPLFATAAGALIAHRCGVPFIAFAPNATGLLVGLIAGAVVTKKSASNRFHAAFALFILIALGSTFFASGLDSVHRWIRLGPIAFNVAMALTPGFLYLLSGSGTAAFAALSLAFSALLLLQPDAGQATAFAAAMIPLCAFKSTPHRLVLLGLIALAILAWRRPDPLPPVDHVERILELAKSLGTASMLAAGVAILLLHAPFARQLLRTRAPVAASFLIYFAVSFLVTRFGNFPVPVLGAGASPVLGWMLAASLSET